ncbi:MAG TPA: DUF47 family protein [Ignavibacteria bacterium]|nr:DUF47 family protein [Ignavibacteria bacterium]
MLKNFLPKSPIFFSLLSEHTKMIHEGALILKEMLSNLSDTGEKASKVRHLENLCDDIAHNIQNELNETFITPIDREDIFSLTAALDNIIDCINTTAKRLNLYKVKTPIKYSIQFSDILLSQTLLLTECVPELEGKNDVSQKLTSIKNYETQGDQLFVDSIADLFENEKEVIELIKKKEILELIEKAVDRCKTATIIIEGILIKNI